MNRLKTTKAFQEYVHHYDLSDPKITLKVKHTYKVADLCEKIAIDLGLNSTEIDFAWLSGMLHDIGRFEQITRYHSFIDKDTVDHAEFGADLLFKEGLISLFVDNYDSSLEWIIRRHNKLMIGDYPDEKALCFAKILRDADKIDIIRVNVETPMEEIYNCSKEDLIYSNISEKVEEIFYEERCIPRIYHQTPIDHLIGHLCFCFELEYPISKKLMVEEGYLEKMLNFESKNPETKEKLSQMKAYLMNYLIQPK